MFSVVWGKQGCENSEHSRQNFINAWTAVPVAARNDWPVIWLVLPNYCRLIDSAKLVDFFYEGPATLNLHMPSAFWWLAHFWGLTTSIDYPPKISMSPKNGTISKEHFIFQPMIFRWHVISFFWGGGGSSERGFSSRLVFVGILTFGARKFNGTTTPAGLPGHAWMTCCSGCGCDCCWWFVAAPLFLWIQREVVALV